MMKNPDLNCDLGEQESPATTAELMRWINSANIACGGHAGNDDSMKRCIYLAKVHNVNIGAHPGLADEGGRGMRFPTPQELVDLLDDQVISLQEIILSEGASLHHIKLHGTLYHATDRDADLAMTYLDWVSRNLPQCRLFLRSGGLTASLAEKKNQPYWNECFLDRAYEADGTLRVRTLPGAMMNDFKALQGRLQLWRDQQVICAHSGEILRLSCQTFCLHSDSPMITEFAKCSHRYFANKSSMD